MTDNTHDRLRVLVFTQGSLLPLHRVFFERLATDPLLDLCAIVVDEYEDAPRSFALRLLRRVHVAGWRSVAFEITSRVGVLLGKAVIRIFEIMHPKLAADEGYDAFGRRIGTRIQRVADLNSEQCLPLIRSLRPQLGVIAAGRLLRDAVMSIPEYGTLSLQQHRLPDVQGVAPGAHREGRTEERTIRLTIQYEPSKPATGSILAEATIAIQACDTPESLRIKADILGANLYHETIRRVALGDREGKWRETAQTPADHDPTEAAVNQLQARLKRRAARRMRALRSGPSCVAKLRLLAQYVALLPVLFSLKNRFVKQARMPIGILCYHVVTNRPVNGLCLPLDEFVRQIEFLRRYFEVVSLEAAVRRVESGRNTRFAVAITFDDGYRDNAWAIEYLRYFGIPASFFVSIGHVRDGSAFEHDRSAGFADAFPMAESDVRKLAESGFLVGSHGIYHEDFGRLGAAVSERVLRESQELIQQVAGRMPEHFAFPFGCRRRNITRDSFELAQKYYRYVYSADGGFNFPMSGRTHFVRIPNPDNISELAMIMDGYTGFRSVLSGNAWGMKADTVAPY